MITALKDAQFLRYGVMHRNTYLDSPRLLDRYYRLRKQPRIAFAGQMTGVEGYVESVSYTHLSRRGGQVFVLPDTYFANFFLLITAAIGRAYRRQQEEQCCNKLQ